MCSLPLLLAAPGFQEIFSVLVGLAFFVIWVINQINDAKKKQQAQQQQPQPRADLPPQPASPAAAGDPPADPLRAQVDDFLRRAGKQPAAARPPQPPRKSTGRDEVVVLLDDSAASAPRKTLADKMQAQSDAAAIRRAKPTASQVPRASKPRPAQPQPQRPTSAARSKSVSEQVASHIGVASEVFRNEVSDLGSRVKQADEQFDRQLHQKFDHELGNLASRTTPGSPPAPATETLSPAAQIAAMLASPDGVRQAVVLNEILQRPTDRW